jgi:hypothetical protein
VNVHYLGPDRFGAERVLSDLSGEIRTDEFGDPERYYSAEQIPEDHEHYAEGFRWWVISRTKEELAGV